MSATSNNMTLGNALSIVMTMITSISVVVYITKAVTAIEADNRVQDQRLMELEIRAKKWSEDHDLLIEIRTDQKRILERLAILDQKTQ